MSFLPIRLKIAYIVLFKEMLLEMANADGWGILKRLNRDYTKKDKKFLSTLYQMLFLAIA